MKTASESNELQQDAQLVIEVLGEAERVALDYSVDSVSWLDGYIERHRADLDAAEKTLLQQKFGAYLGETIRHNYGGRWARDENGEWKIVFQEAQQAAPFAIIGEHLDHHTALSEVIAHLPDSLRLRHN